MLLIGSHRDGVDRAMLGAERAADASISDRVGDEVATFSGGAMAVEVGLEFIAEKPQ